MQQQNTVRSLRYDFATESQLPQLRVTHEVGSDIELHLK